MPLGDTTNRMRQAAPRGAPQRLCVGCGRVDDARAMVRFVLADGRLAIDGLCGHRPHQRLGHARGRGVHVHPRTLCVGRAPRAMARAWKRDARPMAIEIGPMLAAECNARMDAVMHRARRANALVVECANSVGQVLLPGASLWIVAVDAGVAAARAEVDRAVREGKVIAWKTRHELGSLVGQDSVALCGVTDHEMARELQVLRLAADGGTAMTREGAECSSALEAR